MARLIHERADVLPALGEVFREHGFAGASLAIISARTGLGKGSLYHFFPGGKDEMAEAVLAHIDQWFEANVFAPLREDHDARTAIGHMLTATEHYFQSGNRVCVVGVFALGDTRDRFAAAVAGYFARWTDALADALERTGRDATAARGMAEDAVGGLQGALVLARAVNDPDHFCRAIARLRQRLMT